MKHLPWILATAFILAAPVRAVLQLEFLGQDTTEFILGADLGTREGRDYIFTRPHFLFTYRPLTALSFALDHALFGVEPRPFHRTDVILHVFAGLGLFVLASHLLQSPLAGLLAAALVALHPSTTRILSNIDARGEQIMALFGTLAIWSAVRTRSHPRHAWLAALFAFLAFATKESGICVVVPIVVALSLPFGEHDAPIARRLLRLLPTCIAVAALMIVRSRVLGSLTGNPEAATLRQVATLLDLFPVCLFPTVAAPAAWLESITGLSQFAARLVMVGFFGVTMLAGFAGAILALRRGNARERTTIALGAAWLLPQLGVYVLTGYYSPRHAYSLQYAWSLVMVAALFCAVRQVRERPLLLVLIAPWLLPLTLLWLGTGPAAASFAGPLAATRLHHSFLTALERALPPANEPQLIVAVNYPVFTLGNDDHDRFSAADAKLFLPPLGHAVLPTEGATKWLQWRRHYRGQVRTLLVSTSDASVEQFPIVVERKPDRTVIELRACKAHYNLSKTVDYVASLGPQQELLIRKSRLGADAARAMMFVWDGVTGSLEPFPDLLELRLDPSVRGPLYWQQDPHAKQ